MALGNLVEALGVNPFGKTVEVDKKPEVISDVEMINDEAVRQTIKQYGRLRGIDPDHLEAEIEILTPEQIQFSLFGILRIYDEKSENDLINAYLSKMIQTSYQAGNNNFSLNILDELVNIKLEGKKENSIRVTLLGTACWCFAMNSTYSIFDIQGNAGASLGWLSKNCNYTIHGNVSDACGQASENCNFEIMGDAGFILGEVSEECVYDLRKITKYPLSTRIENSIFKVRNTETYNLLAYGLPATNTVQLLDGTGKMIMETKK